MKIDLKILTSPLADDYDSVIVSVDYDVVNDNFTNIVVNVDGEIFIVDEWINRNRKPIHSVSELVKFTVHFLKIVL